MEEAHSKTMADMQAAMASKEDHVNEMNVLHAKEIDALKESHTAALAAAMASTSESQSSAFDSMRLAQKEELARVEEKHGAEVERLRKEQRQEAGEAAAALSAEKAKVDALREQMAKAAAAKEAAHREEVGKLQQVAEVADH